MRKYVALFDWDNTVQKSYAFTTWTNLLLEKQIINSNFINENKKILDAYKAGLLNHDDLAEKGMGLFSQYIEGVKIKDIETVNNEYKRMNDNLIHHIIKDQVFPFLKNNNVEIIVISGSPQPIIELYKEELGLDKIYAMQFDVENDKYLKSFPINTGISISKRKIMNDIINDNKDILFAFGDSISDIPILEKAKYSFVNNNKQFLNKDNIFYLDFNNNETGHIIIDKISECLRTINKE